MRRILLSIALATGIMCTGAVLGAPGTTHAASGKTHTVMIQNFKFVPQHLVVNAGDKVVWINKDSANHTVTGNGSASSLLQSKSLGTNARYSRTLSHAGTIHYHCAFHPFMTATIQVRAHS